MPWRLHRQPLVLGGAILLLLGSVVAYATFPRSASPRAVVSSYFAALQRGDARAALERMQAPAGDIRYLDDVVLKAQQATARITDLRIEFVDPAGPDRASVDVDYDLAAAGGPVATHQVIDVQRAGRRWRIRNGATLVDLRLAAAVDRATLAGRAWPKAPVALFPGAVPVRFDTAVLAAAGTTAAVSPARATQTIKVGVAVTAAGRRTVTAALRAAMDACLHSARPSAGCPLTPPDVRALPGSLRGVVRSVHTSNVDVAGAAAHLAVNGTLRVRGSYRALAFDNVVSTRNSTVSVGFTASCYPTALGRIVWTLG